MESKIKHNKWKLIAGSWMALLLLITFLFLLPETRSAVTMYRQLNDQRQQIASVQNWQTRLKTLQEQRERLETYFSEIYVGLPSSSQMSTIVEEVFRKAGKAGLRLSRIRPSEREEYESHTLIPIAMEAEGNYHQIGRFINEIEQSRYLIKVRKCNLLAGEDEPSRLRAELLVQVIILKRNSERKLQTDA